MSQLALVQTKRALMEHQVEGVEWAKGREHFAYYCEMRLGKTLMYIRLAESEAWRDVHTLLVVAPLTVLGAWKRELELEGEDYIAAYEGKSSAEKSKRCREAFTTPSPAKRIWVLLNYETLRVQPAITNYRWDAVCMDESTKLKNPKAQITQHCLLGFRHCKHRTILSGLPAPEGPLDFFCQMVFLHGKFMGHTNYWGFRTQYFEPDWGGYNFNPKPGVFNNIHHTVHQKAFVKRRADVKLGGKKIYEVREVDLPASVMTAYKKVEKTFTYSEEVETQWAIVAQMWLARIAGGFSPEGSALHTAKIKELTNLLEGELKGEQVVVWFRFNNELKSVADELWKLSVSHRTILGETSVVDREQKLRDFDAKQFSILLCQIKCAKYGIDCSSADTEIYYSNGFSLEDRRQSEDRIVNPTKQSPLLVIDLVAKGTIDEDVIEALSDKGVTATSFMIKLKDAWQRRTGYSI